MISFWNDAEPKRWFAKHPEFYRRFRDRFRDMHFAAARRELNGGLDTPSGTLALLLLIDQFPRSAFRGGHMYATDFLARHFARHACERGWVARVDRPLRLYFCLPFARPEDPGDEALSVELNARPGQHLLSHATGYRDIVARFVRFPHWSHIFGREATPEEGAVLAGGGLFGLGGRGGPIHACRTLARAWSEHRHPAGDARCGDTCRGRLALAGAMRRGLHTAANATGVVCNGQSIASSPT
ncbi:DUF924 family protein [Burkholderia sp. BCC0322]|uniref:DUF924 family protein n=1 Tax=unclassified Burkholderia TaxID=2613784 RepID=UPI001FC7EA52|nr:DUF924 family protein [Burkholderia sp. BCC0322]